MESGYFKDKEFIITNMRPIRHLFNYLWNDSSLCQCDHFGNGYFFRNVGTQRRNIDNGERNVYIKDKKTGLIYSANRNYDNLPFDKYECHVGLGYQEIISEYNGMRVIFSLLVAKDDPVLLFNVKVENISNEKKEFDLIFENCPTPDTTWHAAYSYAEYDKQINGIIYHHDAFNPPNEYAKIFVSCDKKFDTFETSKNRFVGTYNDFSNPESLIKGKLSSLGTTFDNFIAAFSFSLSLNPQEHFEVTFSTATTINIDECYELSAKYLRENAFNLEKQKQIELNDSYIDIFHLDSPDEYLNTQVNIWLKRQLSLGKTWGRIYGKGFRDVMQDITAFISFDCELAKNKILHALKYQYEDGNPIRMFEPNFKYPYNDGGIWIPEAILAYIKESGDLKILDIDVPYLKGDSYENAVPSDAYFTEEYVSGQRKGNVFEHIQAAMDYLIGCRGEHNLVLWRGGDWNDSINNAGNRGIGESVWLSIATVKALNDFLDILNLIDKKDLVQKYIAARDELKAAINKYGRINNYYIYGINDDHEIIGGEERMFLNPQSWAVFADLSSKDELTKTMDKVEEKLKCDFGYVLCSPSFTKGKDNVGRVSYFQPGLVENGGVYNHGVAFKIIADCLLKRGDIAYKTLKLISCDNPKLANSGVEPYAVTNMYIGPENKYFAGFAPMCWVTGTAGWLYRAVTEYICGIKATINGLKIDPCLPLEWDEIKVSRIFRNNKYEFVIKRGKDKGIYVDGKLINGNVIDIPSSNKLIKCEVII